MSAIAQKQNIKIALIVFAIAVLGITSIVLFFVLKSGKESEQPLTQPPSQPEGLSPEAKAIRDKAIENPGAVTGPEGKNLILSQPSEKDIETGNKDFSITYIEPSQLFIIFIFNKSSEDFDQRRKEAEEYFVKEILKTDNTKVACELNVTVQGYKYSDKPSEGIIGTMEEDLSFCKN